jgi:hypothetical protein
MYNNRASEACTVAHLKIIKSNKALSTSRARTTNKEKTK